MRAMNIHLGILATIASFFFREVVPPPVVKIGLNPPAPLRGPVYEPTKLGYSVAGLAILGATRLAILGVVGV